MDVKKSNKIEVKNAHKYAINRLHKIGAYTYHVSKHGSVYIKFENPLMKSLRIADHGSKEKYRYKWNYVLGTSGEIIDSGIDRIFFTSIIQACDEIERFYESLILAEQSVFLMLSRVKK